MRASATQTPLPRLRLAIIGGGFTGTVLAIHAARTTTAPLDIFVLEPRAELGRGVAYGTVDRCHRINVPIDRMDIAAGESGVASAWFRARGILPDSESMDDTGDAYVPRADYGSYVGDVLARTLAMGGERVRLHLTDVGAGWRDGGVRSAGGGGRRSRLFRYGRLRLCDRHARHQQ